MGRIKQGKNKVARNRRRLLPLEEVAYWLTQGEALVKYQAAQANKRPHNEIILLGAICMAALYCYESKRGKVSHDYSHRAMYTLCREALLSEWTPSDTWEFTKEQMLATFMNATDSVNKDQHADDARRELDKQRREFHEQRKHTGLLLVKDT